MHSTHYKYGVRNSVRAAPLGKNICQQYPALDATPALEPAQCWAVGAIPRWLHPVSQLLDFCHSLGQHSRKLHGACGFTLKRVQ